VNKGRLEPGAVMVLLLGLGFLYLPIAAVIAYAFNDSRLVGVWTHPSLRWFGTALANAQLTDAARLSFAVAIGAATLATAIGAMAALRTGGRSPRRRDRLADAVLMSPIVLPDVVIGFSLLLVFILLAATIGWPARRGVATLFLAHAALGAPYAFVVIRAQLAQHDWRLEEAAADLGAGLLTTLRTVTLPLLAPALISAWLAAFVTSFDDVVVASFVSGPGASTLPMVILSSVRLGLSPQANAVAAMLLAAVFVLGGLGLLISLRRRSRFSRP
jgi:putrescine transport system permease protein